jgi:hypothetical protein
MLLRNLFWEMLFQKETGTAFRRYSLASGPEGATLEGRKMGMAGTRGAVNERGSMPTLLNDTLFLVHCLLWVDIYVMN